MQTSTSSDSRSCSRKSNESSALVYREALDVDKARVGIMKLRCLFNGARLREINDSNGHLATAGFVTAMLLLARYCLSRDLEMLLEPIFGGPAPCHCIARSKKKKISLLKYFLTAVRQHDSDTSTSPFHLTAAVYATWENQAEARQY